MSLITIIRGLPGAGKTYLGRKLSAETGAIFIEPDALCIQDGKYNWHTETWRNRQDLARAIIYEIVNQAESDIIYADVLPTRHDVREIIAQTEGSLSHYDVRVIDMPITRAESEIRNQHNVKASDLDAMARAWEPWEEEE